MVEFLELLSFVRMSCALASLVTGIVGIARKRPKMVAASVAVGVIAIALGVLFFGWAYDLAF